MEEGYESSLALMFDEDRQAPFSTIGTDERPRETRLHVRLDVAEGWSLPRAVQVPWSIWKQSMSLYGG